MSSVSAFNAAAAVPGTQITITSAWAGNTLATVTASDIDVVIPRGVAVGAIEIGGWPRTTPIGAVIKINDLILAANLGVVGKDPLGAVAYKFPAREVTTLLQDIGVNVGRTGVLTPFAMLEPVNIGGVIVRQATLHNFDYIAEKDIRIGDRVQVKRAGDVIPYVIGPLVQVRNRQERPYSLPSTCPACGQPVEHFEGEVAWYWVNTACPAQLVRNLEHFASRGAMDIVGLGIKIVIHWRIRRAVFVVFWVALGIHFVFQAPAMWSVIQPGIPFGAVVVLSSFVWKDATTSVQKEQPMPESVKLAPEYDWQKTLWKGLHPALVAGGTAALAALVQSVDAQWLVALGVPAFLATFAWEALRNYLKQHRV